MTVQAQQQAPIPITRETDLSTFTLPQINARLEALGTSFNTNNRYTYAECAEIRAIGKELSRRGFQW